MSARLRNCAAVIGVVAMTAIVIVDASVAFAWPQGVAGAETSDLARLARIDPEAARSFVTIQKRVLRFADEGLSYLPEVVRDLGSVSPAEQSRLDASMSATVCRFARDIEREAAPALLQPLFGRITCR